MSFYIDASLDAFLYTADTLRVIARPISGLPSSREDLMMERNYWLVESFFALYFIVTSKTLATEGRA